MIIDTPKGQVQIRELHSVAEMQAAEEIQLQVWGPDIHPHPKEILIPIQHEGGLVAGAFVGPELVGMVLGFPTSNPVCQHSQILATLPDWRGLGIGAQMKWFQRTWCLDNGIHTVRWTVDPLRAANAVLNIHQLGGLASTYYVDYYGAMQGIDAGVPTDRLMVEWGLDSTRVTERSIQRLPELHYPDAVPALLVTDDGPSSSLLSLHCARIRIPLPDDIIQLSKTDLTLAMEWRMKTRSLFQHYFSAGYLIVDFTRLGGSAYILTQAAELHNSSTYSKV
jgi:chorismate synthase